MKSFLFSEETMNISVFKWVIIKYFSHATSCPQNLIATMFYYLRSSSLTLTHGRVSPKSRLWKTFPQLNWTVLIDRWLVIKGHKNHNSQNIKRDINKIKAQLVCEWVKDEWVASEWLVFVVTSVLQRWWYKNLFFVNFFKWGQHSGCQPMTKRSMLILIISRGPLLLSKMFMGDNPVLI